MTTPRQPRIDGPWWKTGDNPDQGPLGKGQVVDHCFFEAIDGKWQLWACIRHTAVGRLLYRWQSPELERSDWDSSGISMRSEPAYGESHADKDEMLQAPHVIRRDGQYLMFYGGGGSPYGKHARDDYQICLATSTDGYFFSKRKGTDGFSQLFHGPGLARDPMVLKIGEEYFCYYCGSFNSNVRGVVACRTSRDLEHWSDYTIVSAGGSPGSGPYSTECPFVVALDGSYYLFRTSSYVPAVTHVYCSDDPLDFGVDSDAKKIGEIAAAAPEILTVGDRYYISSTADYQGVQLARLAWE